MDRENLSTSDELSVEDEEDHYLNTSHLKKAFDLIDKDQNGYIRSKELTTFFREKFSADISQKDARMLINHGFDCKRKGLVSFSEFVALMQKQLEPQESGANQQQELSEFF